MFEKPLQVDPRTRPVTPIILKAVQDLVPSPQHEEARRILKSPSRDLETLRTLARLLPKRSGVSYDPEVMERRATRRIMKAFNAAKAHASGEIERVLEVGCGRAENAELLHAHGIKSYVGLDIDDLHFPKSDSLPDWKTLVKASAEDMPLATSSVDMAVSFNVFEHLPNPAKALSEIVRVLRPGGVFFTSFGPPFNAAAGPHLTRYADLPYMHHLFTEDVVAALTNRTDAYQTVNRRPLSYYRKTFFAENGFRLASYREQIDGRGFWVLNAIPALFDRLGAEELGVNAITVAVIKAELTQAT